MRCVIDISTLSYSNLPLRIPSPKDEGGFISISNAWATGGTPGAIRPFSL